MDDRMRCTCPRPEPHRSGNLRLKSRSFIEPVKLPTIEKTNRQAKYFNYKESWDRYKLPREDPRRPLCWETRICLADGFRPSEFQDANVRPRTKSFIAPMEMPALEKTNRQAKYFDYKENWDRFKPPGEDPRRALCWETRHHLAEGLLPNEYNNDDVRPKAKSFIGPVSLPTMEKTNRQNKYFNYKGNWERYKLPIDDPRRPLCWETRHSMAVGLRPSEYLRDGNVRPKPRSFIGPVTHPTLEKTNRQDKYFNYKENWDRYKCPEENLRRPLCWETRLHLAEGLLPIAYHKDGNMRPKPKSFIGPMTPPTIEKTNRQDKYFNYKKNWERHKAPEDPRRALCWETRLHLADGLLPIEYHREKDVRPKPKSFIEPMAPPTIEKTNKQNKFYKYKENWERYKPPGDDLRRPLCWETRQLLAKGLRPSEYRTDVGVRPRPRTILGPIIVPTGQNTNEQVKYFHHDENWERYKPLGKDGR